MKLDKSERQGLQKQLKAIGKELGYKSRMWTLYKVEENAFVQQSYYFADTGFSCRVFIKHADYDAIFWRILQMQSNLNEPQSLKAVGAFACPSIWLLDREMDYSADSCRDLRACIVETDRDIETFITGNDIDEYILTNKQRIYDETLKIVASVHAGKEKEAREYANGLLKKSQSGGFINEGKNFCEWLLLMTEQSGTLWNEDIKQQCASLTKK